MSSARSVESPDLADLSTHDAFVDGVPHDTFEYLRREEPLAWFDEPDASGFWALTRHADIVAVNRNYRQFSSRPGIRMEEMSEDERAARLTMMEQDPPEHTRLRRFVNRGFARPLIETYEQRVRDIVVNVLDRALARSEFDCVAEIAKPLPLAMLANVLGVSEEDGAWLAEKGDETPIRWLPRDARYAEKLATPDITIADLIGEVDPIKVAEGRYLADEHTLHYGLVPRTNRGIFAINELPDLAERIQVGLLNLLEERDVQIRGHRVRLPLDTFIVATANPEDYTNRGRIITPLKDRYGAQIRTHYPASIEQEIEIMAQEAEAPETAGLPLHVAPFMTEIIAEITHAARRSPDVNQRSGVSVRASIANFETLTANAVRRALSLDEPEAAPRISDLAYILPSFQGKLEVEAMEEGDEARVITRIVQTAVKTVFGRGFDGADFESVEEAFDEGYRFTAGAAVPAADYRPIVADIPALAAHLEGESPGVHAAIIEFILEGLHLNKRLNKRAESGAAVYSA